MKKYLIATMCIIIACTSYAQKSTTRLTEGAQLLFKNTKSKLTNEEKNWLFQSMKLNLSKDKKQIIMEEYEVTVLPYITDLNKDGIEEVFIVIQSSALFGNTGQGFSLFIKNNSGKLELHDEIGSSGIAMIITSMKTGYPDIAIGGPGFNYPLYRWDGKKYKYNKEIKDADVQSKKIIYTDVAEHSKKYSETLK